MDERGPVQVRRDHPARGEDVFDRRGRTGPQALERGRHVCKLAAARGGPLVSLQDYPPNGKICVTTSASVRMIIATVVSHAITLNGTELV